MIVITVERTVYSVDLLFSKLSEPGASEGTFRSSSQAATCPPVYHIRRRLHTVPFIVECQAGKLWIPIFLVFGLTRPGIEPTSTVLFADALFTRSLIDLCGRCPVYSFSVVTFGPMVTWCLLKKNKKKLMIIGFMAVNRIHVNLLVPLVLRRNCTKYFAQKIHITAVSSNLFDEKWKNFFAQVRITRNPDLRSLLRPLQSKECLWWSWGDPRWRSSAAPTEVDSTAVSSLL